MRTVCIDWAQYRSVDAFYDAVLPQTGAPNWHGRNLDAIYDSWVVGRICDSGPPFSFVFRGTPHDSKFAAEVVKIARSSTRRHGGTVAVESPA